MQTIALETPIEQLSECCNARVDTVSADDAVCRMCGGHVPAEA